MLLLDFVTLVPIKKLYRLVAFLLLVLALKEVRDYVWNKDSISIWTTFNLTKKGDLPLPVTSNSIIGEARANLVRQRCAEVYPDPSSLSNPNFPFDKRMFVANKKGFLYCSIGKTGTSNWKRVLKYLISEERKGEVNVGHLSNPYPHWLPFFGDNVLYKLSPEHQQWSLSRYYKFVFVRDPLKRAISAYRDKFLGDAPAHAAKFAEFHDHYKRVVAKYICKELSDYVAAHPDYPDVESLRLNCTTEYQTFSLKAFLTWLYILPLKGGKEFKRQSDHFNPHWAPMIPLCSICNSSFSYDYIGKLETMSDDVSTLFSQLNLTFPFPTLSDTALSDEVRARFKLEEQGLDKPFLDQIDKVLNRERYVLGYTDELYDSWDDPYLAN